MSKMVVGGVCLAAGLVAGVFAGPMVNDGGLKDAKTAKEAAAKAQEKAETDAKVVAARVAELESAESSLRSKLSSAESVAEMRAAEAKQAREAATSAANALAEAEKKADTATAELATLKSGGTGVNAAAGGPVDAAEAARIAQVRAKGKSLADKIKAVMENAGPESKKEVLDAMRELGALGKDASKEFFDAFVLVQAKGNAWGGKNELKLTMPEFVSLMPKEFRDLALADPNSDVPVGAKMYAMYSLPWDGTFTTAQKVETLGKILDSTRDGKMAQTALDNLGFVASKDSMPYLVRAAGNGALDSDARARAVMTIAGFKDDADWTTIENLTHDPDPKVSAAARVANYVRKPPATGVLVQSLRTGDGVVTSDLRVGDIIQKYNGEVITTEQGLMTAIYAESQKGTQQIIVDIWRDGKADRITTRGGDLGISGIEVKQ